nr:hypothetical protein [uncultured Flavobacterium sp.]
MATINELQLKRENLLIQIGSVTYDLREYTKYPCETVDLENIKNQYSFILREIKQIDEKIKFLFNCQLLILETDLKIMEKEIITSEKVNIFASSQKTAFSLFDEPFI